LFVSYTCPEHIKQYFPTIHENDTTDHDYDVVLGTNKHCGIDIESVFFDKNLYKTNKIAQYDRNLNYHTGVYYGTLPPYLKSTTIILDPADESPKFLYLRDRVNAPAYNIEPFAAIFRHHTMDNFVFENIDENENDESTTFKLNTFNSEGKPKECDFTINLKTKIYLGDRGVNTMIGDIH
jgi:hypothetical protein